jgi:methionine-gamma-lyase
LSRGRIVSSKIKPYRTKAIHAGEFPDPITGASSPNLVVPTTFVADAGTGFSVESLSEDDPFIYTRWGNPTIRQLEEKLAVPEEAATAVAFAGGMNAAATLLLHTLKAGDQAGGKRCCLSAGLEDADDLTADLEQALA